MRTINQKIRAAIDAPGRIAAVEGLWWQYSLTERSAKEPSAESILQIRRDRDGGLNADVRS